MNAPFPQCSSSRENSLVVEEVSTVTLLADMSERSKSAFEAQFKAVPRGSPRVTSIEKHKHAAIICDLFHLIVKFGRRYGGCFYPGRCSGVYSIRQKIKVIVYSHAMAREQYDCQILIKAVGHIVFKASSAPNIPALSALSSERY